MTFSFIKIIIILHVCKMITDDGICIAFGSTENFYTMIFL